MTTPRTIDLEEREALDAVVEELLALGHIEPTGEKRNGQTVHRITPAGIAANAAYEASLDASGS